MLALGWLGAIVTVQHGGTLDLFCRIARTWPVTVDAPDLVVAVLPLNCAIRKRRTSFSSVVSNVNMKLSSVFRDYRRSTLVVYENSQP
jgi:hypothetical protein